VTKETTVVSPDGTTYTTRTEAETGMKTLNSPLLKSRFDHAGSAVTATTRTANPSGDAATRMIATASSVSTKKR
jgi:hypothetical protein